jgi:hypothetical protein
MLDFGIKPISKEIDPSICQICKKDKSELAIYLQIIQNSPIAVCKNCFDLYMKIYRPMAKIFSDTFVEALQELTIKFISEARKPKIITVDLDPSKKNSGLTIVK